MRKTFWVTQSGHLFQTIKKAEVEAVGQISFSVKEGERIAFVGPNGAGKSTTIKILTGILHPTSGSAHVLGFVPWKERQKLAYQIGTVFGQKTQLWYHLPPKDTFDLLARVYDQDSKAQAQYLATLVNTFEIEHILNKPVRQLSLGERMRCEIVASLLHHPKILFLDEPTIGLDVTAKAIIRNLIKKISEQEKTTIFLTSHDTGDMENVCDRVIIVHQGKLVIDQPIETLRKTYIKRKRVTLLTEKQSIQLDLPGLQVVESSPHRLVLELDSSTTSIEKVISAAIHASPLRDLTIEDPPMEEIIQNIYKPRRQ